jgi:hypothetical protein
MILFHYNITVEIKFLLVVIVGGKTTGGGFKYLEEIKHSVFISKISRRLQALKLTHSFSLVFSTHIAMLS